MLNCLTQLSAAERETLLAFAEFLVQRSAAKPSDLPSLCERLAVPRLSQETVIGAIKRLSQTYPMLNREALFNDTSALMSAHVMQGRSAESVIDALETLFAQQYQTYCEAHAAAQ